MILPPLIFHYVFFLSFEIQLFLGHRKLLRGGKQKKWSRWKHKIENGHTDDLKPQKWMKLLEFLERKQSSCLNAKKGQFLEGKQAEKDKSVKETERWL